MEQKQLPGSISFYGASSVYGIGDPEGGFVARFRKWYDHHRVNGVVYNMGIPAETTNRLVERFKDEHIRRNSHLIFFKIGTNDSHRQPNPNTNNYVSLDEFLDNARTLIDVALKSARVAFISPYPLDDNANPHGENAYFLTEDVARYKNALKEMVVGEYNLVFIDIFNDWIKMQDYKDKFLSEDGLHANGNGYQYIAEQVQEAVLRNFSHF